MTKSAKFLLKTSSKIGSTSLFGLQITLELHITNRMKLRSEFCFLQDETFGQMSTRRFLYGVSYKQELTVF